MSIERRSVNPQVADLFANLIRRLQDRIDASGPPIEGAQTSVPISEYCSPERFAHERKALFACHPMVVAHASELEGPGACMAWDDLGVPIVLLRGADGVVRGFFNVCRHRGARLVTGASPCRTKVLVCPYHGWTYNLSGALMHIPHRHTFPLVDAARFGLVELPVAERFGLIWLAATPGATFDLDGYLGPLSTELAALELDHHLLYRRAGNTRRANWKLIIDAFLEGYHIRHLHRDSVYPFFIDSCAVSDRVYPHIRSGSARRGLRTVRDAEVRDADPRAFVTLSYFLFPNTVLIFHPDYVSVVSAFPIDATQSRWTHCMLIPEPIKSAAQARHWQRSFELIERAVFQDEDLHIAESLQAGMASGANEVLTLGQLEHAVHWFHDAIADALAGSTQRHIDCEPQAKPDGGDPPAAHMSSVRE